VTCGLWLARRRLVAAVARAATLLARLPSIPLLRASLRRLSAPDARQLPLL
jgi:hypothetical protein